MAISKNINNKRTIHRATYLNDPVVDALLEKYPIKNNDWTFSRIWVSKTSSYSYKKFFVTKILEDNYIKGKGSLISFNDEIFLDQNYGDTTFWCERYTFTKNGEPLINLDPWNRKFKSYPDGSLHYKKYGIGLDYNYTMIVRTDNKVTGLIVTTSVDGFKLHCYDRFEFDSINDFMVKDEL